VFYHTRNPQRITQHRRRIKEALCHVGGAGNTRLGQGEILRLRGIISGVKTYKELLENYLDYRGLEVELLEAP